jgi:hypothetical protein
MRSAATLTLLALVGLAPAADPPPDLALKVRVALALHQCQCETPGAKCADPAADLRTKVAADLRTKVAAALAVAVQPPAPTAGAKKPTDNERYAALRDKAAKIGPGNGYGLMAVGKKCPAEYCHFREEFPSGFLGIADGVYECRSDSGAPVMTRRTEPMPVPAGTWQGAIIPGTGPAITPRLILGPFTAGGADCVGGS